MIELRCSSKLHGIIVVPGQGVIEVKCGSRFCGHGKGAVVLHRFDIATGQIIENQFYKDPSNGSIGE